MKHIIKNDRLYRQCPPCPKWANWIVTRLLNPIAERGIDDCYPPKVSCIILRHVAIGLLLGVVIGAAIATTVTQFFR